MVESLSFYECNDFLDYFFWLWAISKNTNCHEPFLQRPDARQICCVCFMSFVPSPSFSQCSLFTLSCASNFLGPHHHSTNRMIEEEATQWPDHHRPGRSLSCCFRRTRQLPVFASGVLCPGSTEHFAQCVCESSECVRLWQLMIRAVGCWRSCMRWVYECCILADLKLACVCPCFLALQNQGLLVKVNVLRSIQVGRLRAL